MKLFVKLVFYCNFLFWGGGFLLAFLQYIAYNGFGDIFEYVKPEYLETRVEIDSITETKTIIYKYTIDKKNYESKQSIYISRIAARDFYESNVYYNKQIPCLSYIGKKELNEMIDEGESIEVNCHFCNRHYNFSVEELTDIRDRAVR